MSSELPNPWVDGQTIGDVLRTTAQRYPEAPALVFMSEGLQWNYRQFAAEVERCARGLVQLGIQPGQHVAVWATNVSQWIVLQFATARLGAVLVTINPAYRPFELEYVLRQSDAAALFLIDSYRTSDYLGMLLEVCPELAQCRPGELGCDRFPELRHVVALRGQPPAGARSWSDLLALGQADADGSLERQLHAFAGQLSATDPINIQYTSGTTGFPKAAMLSHRNLLLNAYYAGQRQRLTAADRICVPVPFYHCFGCVMGSLCAVVHAAAMVVPAESFDPRATLECIESQRATVLYGVPTMFIAQLTEPSFAQRDLSSLRTGIMAGSPCPIEVMRQVVDRMGIREITIAYGQTEASPVITQTSWDDPLELRVETVGRPLPGVEVKLVDRTSGQTLGDNQTGELCARGHVVMLGYYQDPEATAAAIQAEGWLHTGDLALRMPNGCYRITGRIKDMVIRGGENIYPREIEEFLFTHPAIEQASVVGVPDPKFGEELCAWIKLRPGMQLDEQAVRDYCRQRLARYKIPKYVRFVEAFPQTVTGKIQKFKMRQQMIDELGLTEAETA